MKLPRWLDKTLETVEPTRSPMVELRYRIRDPYRTPVLEYRTRLIDQGRDFVALSAWGPWQTVPTAVEQAKPLTQSLAQPLMPTTPTSIRDDTDATR